MDPTFAAAHARYFEARDWAAALKLWIEGETAGAPCLESRLAINHCRIELADPAPLDDARALPTRSIGWQELYGHLIRLRAMQFLSAGDAARAARLTRLLGGADAEIGALYDQSIRPPGDGAPIRAAAATGPGDLLPFQRDLMLDAADARDVVERHRRRRILFAVRRFVDTGGVVVETDLYRHLRQSAEALAFDFAVLETHLVPAAQRPRFADGLRALVQSFRPEMIVYDDMLVSGVAADPALLPGILAVLGDARQAGSKIVFLYPDAWYDGQSALMEAAADLPDLFFVHHPALRHALSPAVVRKTLFYPGPTTDPRDPPGVAPAPAPRACFVGGINWTSMSRLAWWAEIADAGLAVDLYPSVRATDRTPAQYADLLSRYAIALNLTARSNGRRILTSRTLEGPLYGALLLEEHTEDTAYFMRPFEHYVPFATFAELQARLDQLLTDAPLRTRIAQAGSAWVRRYFSGEQLWARLFWKLYEDPAARPAGGRYDFQPRSVAIPVASAASWQVFGKA